MQRVSVDQGGLNPNALNVKLVVVNSTIYAIIKDTEIRIE